MSNERSYDDMFDGAAFRTSSSLSKAAGPKMWPRSTSEMRRHVAFASQGVTGLDSGDAYLGHKAVKSTGAAAPSAPARSACSSAAKSCPAKSAPKQAPKTAMPLSRKLDWASSSSA